MGALTGLLLATVAVTTTNVTWHDSTRHRDVLAKIYAPKPSGGPWPLIVFSHGLGGSREGYAYLGQQWASSGYVCVHVQHPGSDARIFQPGDDLTRTARQAAADPQNWRDRPLDVSFAISQMWHDPRVNTNAIGVAGHSFGAHTTLEVIGLRVAGESFRDPRVTAAIAMSAPRPWSERAFRDVAAPCLHLTGTRDDSPLFATTAADRRFAFDHITAGHQYLVILKDAEHFAFSDHPRWAGQLIQRNPRHHELIGLVTTVFWNAWLKQDRQAKQWLDQGGLTAAVQGDATVEQK